LEELVTLNVFGQQFTFKSDEAQPHLSEVAVMIENEIEKVTQQYAGSGSQAPNLAILLSATLNIANENVGLKKSEAKLIDLIAQRSDKLLTMLNQ
jgi:cell division protein ZapA (FtsZ GTPase activity inhibitor)